MKQLKDISVLTTTALLIAIATVLGFLKIPVNQLIELRFAYLPIAASGMLFGPAIGGIVGMLADILGYLVRPTGPFFPGFTISTAVSGIIFGAFFYKKKLTVPRVILANLVETVVVSLILNTINLMILYGNPFWAVLSAKLLKNAVMFPINTVLLLLVLRALDRLPLPAVQDHRP